MPKMHQTLTYRFFKITVSIIFFLLLGSIFVAIYFRYYKNQSIIGETDVANESKLMKITVNAFSSGNLIDSKFTCDGQNISPEIIINYVPEKAKTLVLVIQDANSNPGGFVHMLMRNIPAANTVEIKEGKLPLSFDVGTNDFGKSGYGGPCPSKGETHKYYFKIYALDTTLDLDNNSNIYQLQGQMNSRIISKAEIIGSYKR